MNLIYVLRNNDPVSCIGFHKHFLLLGSERISIWNLKNGKLIAKGQDRSGNILKILSFNDCIYVHARDENIIKYSWPALEQMATINVNTLNFCAFDLDYRGSFYLPSDLDSKQAQIIDQTASSKSLSSVGDSGIIMCLFTFSRLGRLFLAGGFEDGSVGIWDVELESCEMFKDHSEPVLCVYVIDDYGIVSGGADGKLVIRTFDPEVKVNCLEFNDARGISSLSYSASKKVIAAGGWNGTYYIYFNN